MGNKNTIEISLLTHEKILFEAAEKYPGLSFLEALKQFRQLQLNIKKFSRSNSSGSTHKILITTLFINAISYSNSIPGRN